MEKIREMFNQVQINVLLLDGIQQVPLYAKFLKTCAPRREKQMFPKWSSLPHTSVSCYSCEV